MQLWTRGPGAQSYDSWVLLGQALCFLALPLEELLEQDLIQGIFLGPPPPGSLHEVADQVMDVFMLIKHLL